MEFMQVFNEIKRRCEGIDLSKLGDKHLVYEVNLTGEGGGTFYAEIKDGKLNLQPYDYHDNTCSFTLSVKDLEKLANKQLNPITAFTFGKIKAKGDLSSVLAIKDLLSKH